MIVSPGAALLIAQVIDRHVLSFETQLPGGQGRNVESTPLFAT